MSDALSRLYGVQTKKITTHDRALSGPKGKAFIKLVDWAARKVGVDRGLLAASMLAETTIDNYLKRGNVGSLVVGTDHYYSKYKDIERRIPAAKDIGWDRKVKPEKFFVDQGKTKAELIYFKSGRDAALAHAAYLKHGELRLKEITKKDGKDFSKLTTETRYALTRIAFRGGHGRAGRNLREALAGKDILIRKEARLGPQRTATIVTAQAYHFKNKFFK